MLLSVTGYSVGPERRHIFWPIDEAWQIHVASTLGRLKPTSCLYAHVIDGFEMPNQNPRQTIDNTGRGACLAKTISMAIYGHERRHQYLRNAVVDFILKTPLPSEITPRDQAFYKRMANMRISTTWMTSDEIEGKQFSVNKYKGGTAFLVFHKIISLHQGFAYLLDTPIFVCVYMRRTNGGNSFHWERTPHPLAPRQVTNKRGIYIISGGGHFKLVVHP